MSTKALNVSLPKKQHFGLIGLSFYVNFCGTAQSGFDDRGGVKQLALFFHLISPFQS